MLLETARQAGAEYRGDRGGVPGPARSAGVVGDVGTLPGWEGSDIATALSREFGVPVAVENDADSAALPRPRGTRRGAAADSSASRSAPGSVPEPWSTQALPRQHPPSANAHVHVVCSQKRLRNVGDVTYRRFGSQEARSWAWTHDEVRQVSVYAPGSSSEGRARFGHLRGLGAMYLAACPASDSGEPWRDAVSLRKEGSGSGRVRRARHRVESFQVASLSWRYYSLVRSVVPEVSDFLCAHGRDGARTWSAHPLQLHLALGPNLRAGTG